MSKNKSKFDLTKLVHAGLLKEGETLFFVSEPSKTCVVHKTATHEFKVQVCGKDTTIHLFVRECLGQDCPNHASMWLKNKDNKTLYSLWQSTLDSSDE